ncbi:MAG: D-alanine--D-alanine ligase family protein [bacterium]
MKIGLTYDLRKEYTDMGFTEEETAEFDSEETINSLEETIRNLGHETIRIGNIYELVRRIASGERWEFVFNVTEGLHGRSREAQVPALLEAFNIPYTFSDPLTLSLCLDKAMTKRIVRDAGIPTPDFAVIQSLHELEGSELPNKGKFPLFVKPVAEGTGKGVTADSIIRDMDALKRQVRKLLIRYNQPVLIETFLPGKEFTVGILGTGSDARAIGALEVKLLKNAEPGVYSFMNKELCEERVKYVLVEKTKILKEAVDVALRAYRALGCRDAGRVDLKTDGDGKICFVEMNPLAGLHPTHSDLPILCTQVGIPYSVLISGIIESALKRKRETETKSKSSASAPTT